MREAKLKKIISGNVRVFRLKGAAPVGATLLSVVVGMAAHAYGIDFSKSMANYNQIVPQEAEVPKINLPSFAQIGKANRVSVQAFASSTELPVTNFEDTQFEEIQFNFDRISQLASGDGVIVHDVTEKEFGLPEVEITKEIHDAIVFASEATGVPKSVLYAFASKESTFDKNAKARTSSAEGLMQHTDATWRGLLYNFGEDYGYGEYAAQIKKTGKYDTAYKSNSARKAAERLKFDPKHSALMAAVLLGDNRWRVESLIERKLNQNEYYVTHFMGAANAAKFLSALDRDPNLRVDRVSSTSAWHNSLASNRSIFVRNGRWITVGQAMSWFNDVMGARNAFFALKYEDKGSSEYSEAVEYAKLKGVFERHAPDEPTEQRFAAR